MENEIIQNIWNKGNYSSETFKPESLEKLMKKNARNNTINIKVSLWFYFIIMIISEVLSLINIFGYSVNSTMLAIQFGVGLTGAFFILFGIFLLKKYYAIEKTDQSIASYLKQQLKFLRSDLIVWNILVSVSLVFCTFGFNTLIDNNEGQYVINNAIKYFSLHLGIALFVFVLLHSAQYLLVKELRIYLQDLNDQIFEKTAVLVESKKRMRILFIVLFVLLTAVLIILILQTL